MKITYYGHSTFSIELAGAIVLFDPFISANPLAQAKGIQAASLKADHILISHAHGDHTGDLVAIAKRTGAKCVSNFEICNWLNAAGISNTVAMNHGGAVTLPFGEVKYVNAIHSSSFPDGTYGGNPGGFVVRGRETSFYYSGDTALTSDMKLIGEDGPVDFAILCMGDVFTMGARDAVKAAQCVGARKVMGVHYDTFPPIRIDHEKARKTFADSGLALLLVPVGESISVGK